MPFKLLLDDEMGEEWIAAFSDMAKPDFNSQKTIENFVCALYGMQHSNDTNFVRKIKLKKLLKPDRSSAKKLKKVDCGLLPPCQKVLQLKMQRSNMIARLWLNADQPNPSIDLDPLNFGWIKVENTLYPKWYDGSPLPSAAQLETPDEIDTESEDDLSEAEAEWSESSDEE